MTQTALILGPTGRFGRALSTALQQADWHVTPFRRGVDHLPEAARGMDLIVNGWNPPYQDWARQLPHLTQSVVEAAETSGATLLMPGNVYVYGARAAELMRPDSAHAATNPLGKLRITLEARLKASRAQTILLRAGDYLDTEASGNWFDKVMVAGLGKGRFVYPGAMDRVHAFAFLPDLARVGVALANRRADLPRFSDIPFEGYSITGADLHRAVEQACGRRLTAKPFPWPATALAAPFSPMLRCLREMRYLWDMPHRLDPAPLQTLLGDVPGTPLVDAVRAAIRPLQG